MNDTDVDTNMIKQDKAWRRSLSLLGTGALAVSMLYLAGCRQQMADQPSFKPLEDSAFFKDGASSRTLIEGTVARGQMAGTPFAIGKVGDKEMTEMPMPVTKELLERGRQRYDISCAVCHGKAGDGESMTTKQMIIAPRNLHIESMQKAPVGHFVNVIANGFGSMYAYGSRVAPADRWAIAAYIRALQLSQNASAADVAAAKALP
jgi:mono/diheme cytochrome c family protein